MLWIVREKQKEESKFNAGSKARIDVDTILVNNGAMPVTVQTSLKKNGNILKTIRNHLNSYKEWKVVLDIVKPDDTVIIQYPVRNHTIFLGRLLNNLHKKNVTTIAIIHDLESLRFAISHDVDKRKRLRYKVEEIPALAKCDKIIVHNASMKSKIVELFGIPENKMIVLGIFDYLFTEVEHNKKTTMNMPIVIAGNLSRSKAGYIYSLPNNLNIVLYGANYDGSDDVNIHYKGSVEPDELPSILNGSFGLVWDGPSSETCSGVFGEYLKYNNPHKTSLYLASGIPVIVWKESAMAPFVVKNKCGLCVGSINEIRKEIDKIDAREYESILQSVDEIRKKLQKGYFTKNAIALALESSLLHE